ncbi:hypothetical protein MBLNU457_1179t2 [Dothideomycetes sp. NU457]
MGGSADEFPLLSALGLYAADIRGDGNCLFNALSDQLYGHQGEHHNIRAQVIDYMREHGDYYKQFIDVQPGGGVRRNPKRKNAGTCTAPVTVTPPSQADIDRVFESHLQSMARGGTYGDNMEISAFSSAYNVDVKIYQRDFAYMVSGSDTEGEKKRAVAHIAYHMWEHYSSIRNLDGPHTGLPEVQERALSPAEEKKQKEQLAQTPMVLPWQVDVVSKSLPFLADKPTIKRALEEAKGNIDAAVSKLLDREENGSTSSTQESSSIEREADSDDDPIGPNKKRDRRMSRAARHKLEVPGQRQVMSKLATHNASQDSIADSESEVSSIQYVSQDDSIKDEPDTTHEVKRAESSSSAPPRGPRIKLKGPRPPAEHVDSVAKQKQSGPKVSARDRKDMKKQAQKAARKERARGEANGGLTKVKVKAGSDGITQSPQIESGFRTLYI